MEQNCLSAQSKNVYLKSKFKKIIITNTYLLFEKESKKLMKIFDSNNSSSEKMWETGVEFGNSHVKWIAGNLKSAGRGPEDTPTVAFPGRECSAQTEGTFLRLQVYS